MTMSDNGKSTETAPNGAARKTSLPKRFYKDVSVKDEERGGASLQLDGKPVRTPGKALLLLRARALAEAIAAEWRAQGERIDPSTMPLTRLANSAIDGVVGREQAVVDDIVRHAGSDLICYRAEGPKALVEAQRVKWDPVLAFARDELEAPLVLSEGVVHVAQPEASLAQHQAGDRRPRCISARGAACHDGADRLCAACSCRAARQAHTRTGVASRPCR